MNGQHWCLGVQRTFDAFQYYDGGTDPADYFEDLRNAVLQHLGVRQRLDTLAAFVGWLLLPSDGPAGFLTPCKGDYLRVHLIRLTPMTEIKKSIITHVYVLASYHSFANVSPTSYQPSHGAWQAVSFKYLGDDVCYGDRA